MMNAIGNGQAHEHVWVLHREDKGRSYEPTSINEALGDWDELPYREVTLRIFYCEICREVAVDKEYGELVVPLPRPPRPRRRWPWLPVSWRPW